VKENKRHYDAAAAQVTQQSKSGMAGFVSSFMASRAFKAGQDEE
jgi:hypothetical protein